MSDRGVGITNNSEGRASKTRFKYSSRAATLPARQADAGSGRSRVSAPAAATTITPPVATANHTESVNSGYSTVETSTQATAAVTVIRRSWLTLGLAVGVAAGFERGGLIGDAGGGVGEGGGHGGGEEDGAPAGGAAGGGGQAAAGGGAVVAQVL